MSKDIKKWTELTEAREKADLSQKALADILGVDPVCVNRWEHGDSKPTFETTQRLAKILNVELSTLIGGRELHHAEDEPKEKAIKRFATKMIVQAIDTGLTAKPLAFHVTESKGVVAVKFPDGETYVSHCSKEDHFDIEVGVALAIARHLYGSRTAFLKAIKEDSVIHDPEPVKPEPKKKGANK